MEKKHLRRNFWGEGFILTHCWDVIHHGGEGTPAGVRSGGLPCVNTLEVDSNEYKCSTSLLHFIGLVIALGLHLNYHNQTNLLGLY